MYSLSFLKLMKKFEAFSYPLLRETLNEDMTILQLKAVYDNRKYSLLHRNLHGIAL